MSTEASELAISAELWQAIESAALTAGLDTSKFADQHHAIVKQIAAFLQQPVQPQSKQAVQATIFQSITRRFSGASTPSGDSSIPAPIILVGKPGTGKTTFLYVLDSALRSYFSLPDNVEPCMRKGDGRSHSVQKRRFCGQQLSLLSVRQWAELLHFYEWDVQRHRLVSADLEHFITTKLTPMRIIFADEVEITGYSPTIPTLAKHGILVVGTSNQTTFPQLAKQAIPPQIYQFDGNDMRFGDPDDAIVHATEAAWQIYDKLLANDLQQRESLKYRAAEMLGTVYLLLQFEQALAAPFLESQWLHTMQTIYDEFATEPAPLNPNAPFILLLESFSLAALVSNYDAIIRFVALFDAIEQIGIGVLVRNMAQPPTLSRDALRDMKTTIWNTTGVPDAIKQKAVVGIDRLTSRIGQAGHKAQATIKHLKES